jgi:hypothetical protein
MTQKTYSKEYLEMELTMKQKIERSLNEPS